MFTTYVLGAYVTFKHEISEGTYHTLGGEGLYFFYGITLNFERNLPKMGTMR